MSSALYRGALVHKRRDHLHRTFRYPVFMAAIDLDELDVLDRDLRLFSHNRRNLFALHDRDYTTSLSSVHDARSIAPKPSTTLVTNLRFAGYAFNPVSFFLRYEDDRLVGVIAEVNNTYGGRHCYTLDASNQIAGLDTARPPTAARADTGRTDAARTDTGRTDAARTDTARTDTGRTDTARADTGRTDTARADTGRTDTARADTGRTDTGRTGTTVRAASRNRIGFRTSREFFVSPFLHGPRVYEWWFPARRDPARLAITMHVDTLEGDRIFTATMAGERHALTDLALLGAAVRYPLNTVQVIGLIHLEALKLRYLHHEPYRRPGPDHRPLEL